MSTDPVMIEQRDVLCALCREVGNRIATRLTSADFDTMAVGVAVRCAFSSYKTADDVIATYTGAQDAAWAFDLLDRVFNNPKPRDIEMATGLTTREWYSRYYEATRAVYARHGLDEYGCVPRRR